MIIRLFPSDETGCGFYRMLEPARVLRESGLDVEIQVVIDPEEEGGLVVTMAGKLGNEKVVKVEDPQCDVIVLQRPAHRHLVEAIPHIQAHGTAVVVDYDDDFDALDPRHVVFKHYEPSHNPMTNKVWARLASQLADMVTVTTPALARRYGGRGLVVELPNCVPASYLEVKPEWTGTVLEREGARIGWHGSTQTHPGDLEVMGNVFIRWREDAVFRTIGERRSALLVGANTGTHPDFEYSDWLEIDQFHAAVASFDIGIVPLKDSAFNKAKSWLKGLEYAALGVPFVASPMPEYKRLAQLGAGDLVNTTTKNSSSWRRALDRLVDDAAYAELRAARGREVASELTYEEHGERWLHAWANALTLRRS